jgi:hypothetical protein
MSTRALKQTELDGKNRLLAYLDAESIRAVPASHPSDVANLKYRCTTLDGEEFLLALNLDRTTDAFVVGYKDLTTPRLQSIPAMLGIPSGTRLATFHSPHTSNGHTNGHAPHLNSVEQTASSEEDNEDEPDALSLAAGLPAGTVERLPAFYRRLIGLYPTHGEQLVFLCGMLPVVASCLPKVAGSHADGYYSPDLFVAVVAAAGAGKGVAAQARKLAEGVDEFVTERSLQAVAAFKAMQAQAKEAGNEFSGIEPPECSHLMPANTSAAAFFAGIYDNGGRGLTFESEIDMMGDAHANSEWGDYSSFLRCAFHHETISVKRKTQHQGRSLLKIQHPCVSVFLSGTSEQFANLMRSTENGLFSRFAAYFHNPPLHWRSHRPTPRSTERPAALEEASQLLLLIYKTLEGRTEPLYIDLTAKQWDMIDSTFAGLQEQFLEQHSPDLLPTARRGAIIAFRLALQFTVLRHVERVKVETFTTQCDVSRGAPMLKSLEANDDDVQAAVALAMLLADHAARLTSILPRRPKQATNQVTGKMAFFESLPDEFETKEAVEIAKTVKISERTAKRYLLSLTEEEILTKYTAGKYAKCATLCQKESVAQLAQLAQVAQSTP